MGNKNGLGAVDCDRGQTTIRITPGSIDCKFEDNYARRPLFTYRGNPCSFEVHTPWDQLRPKLVKGLRPCDKPTIATINEALSEAEVARFNDDLAAAGTQRARDQVAEHWQRQALEQRLLKKNWLTGSLNSLIIVCMSCLSSLPSFCLWVFLPGF